MSHALIWTELNSTDLTSETSYEIPFAGFGTIVAGTWNKKLFKLKWINSSVSDVKVWIDSPYADIYTSGTFPQIAKNQNLSLLQDLGFEVRMTSLDGFVVNQLDDANVASNLNISTGTLSGVNRLQAPHYIDGVQITADSKILVKSQTSLSENGLYDVLVQDPTSSSDLAFYYGEDILTAGKIVSIGSSSWYSHLKSYSPFQTASVGVTSVTWVDRSSTYKLLDVQASTTANLNYTGSSIAVTTSTIDGRTLVANDRILVKDQTTKSQNGIYYVSSLYGINANTLVDVRTSTSSSDDFWDNIVSYISNNIPVNVQTLHGSTYGGKYYRYYSATASTSGSGSTADLLWTDATHYYNTTTADFYYEINSTSGIAFSSGSGNAGILRSTPSVISGNGSTNFELIASHKVLVKHNVNPAYSGIYSVINVGSGGTGSTGFWERSTSFDTIAEILPTIVNVTNNKASSTNSEFFYLNRENTYQSNYILNTNNISVSDRFKYWTYEPVSNLINKNISDFTKVNVSNFSNAGIAISQRVLVSGQSNTTQNGLYITANSSLGSTLGLSFYSSYYIERGALATSSGSGSTFFLYASGTSTAAGSTVVKWVDMSLAPIVKISATTTKDKFSSGTYINTEDFDANIGTGVTVLVNTTNKLVNGIYTSTLGKATKAIFSFTDGLQGFLLDIYKNILTTSSSNYTLSPNFREQITGKYLASSIASTQFGDLFVPEISYPATNTYADYFTNGNGSALLQDVNIDWYDQNFQKYKVKGVYYSSSIAGLPISSGTAISSGMYNGVTYTQINNNDDVLFYIGGGNASTSSYNGIYRAVKASTGSSVYFTKHEDFNFSSVFEPGKNIKTLASPYERPTKVIVNNGYFIAGTAFTFSRLYMQGILGYRIDNLGGTAITADDYNQINAGSETYIKDSDIFISRDYDNLHNFANVAPIQHFLSGSLSLYDKINKDMLIVNRGQQLYSLRSGSLNKNYYEVGDRIIYQDSSEDTLSSASPLFVNGIYQIAHIDTTNWTYYLRKVKYNSVNGHIDHAKRLKLHANNLLTDVSLSLVRYEGTGSTYRFLNDNYPVGDSTTSNMDVIVITPSGTATTYHIDDDFIYSPSTGVLTPYSSLGSTNDELIVYIYNDFNTPRYNQTPNQLFNRNYNINQVLRDKLFLNNNSAKSGFGWTAEKSYFIVHNSVGNATTTDNFYSRDRKNWFNEYNVNKKYHTYIHHIVGVGSTSDYFFTKRLSSDGYYRSAGSAYTSNFIDTGLIEPGTVLSTGLFIGSVYLEKNKYTSGGYAATTWFEDYSFTADQNVLVISNTSAILSTQDRSTYYNNKNVLVSKTTAGKPDTKIYKFSGTGYSSVTLAYHSAFNDPLSPIKASAGITTYFLYFDPDSTSRTTSERSWIDIQAVSKYNAAVSTNVNISDLTNLGTNKINSQTVVSGNIILVKDQTDKNQNGIYSVTTNNIYQLIRTQDFNSSSHLRALGRVSYGNQSYELILPNSSYTLGSTPIVWNLVGTAFTFDAAVATLSNYSAGTALTNFPDTVDSYTLVNNDKILMLGQSNNAEKYLGRFQQNIKPILSRVSSGGSGNTDRFSITNCFVYDTNKTLEYELYFDPANTSLGTDDISWFRRNYISNYSSCSTASTTNYNVSGVPDWSTVTVGSRVILKDQTDKKQNGIYVINNNKSFFLIRNEDLDESSEFDVNKKVRILAGNANTGYYGLMYDENISPAINSTSMYWTRVNELQYLNDCNCATSASETDIVLNNPPTTVDGFTLEKNHRVLVKNQDSNKEQNGIYVVTDAKNKIWQRSGDLDSSAELVPQLTTNIISGTLNAGKIYRISLPVPATITNSQLTAYDLETTEITWVEVSANGIFSSSPDSWQKIGVGTSSYFNLGSYDMSTDSVAQSKRFGIAIKVPTTDKLATNLITENGKVRNIRFKVEYKTKED